MKGCSVPRGEERPSAEFEGSIYIRTTPAEADRLGRLLAFKLCAAAGPVTMLMPHGGLSVLDVPGGPFWQRIPAYANVTEEQFLDHTWQAKNTITNPQKLLAALQT